MGRTEDLRAARPKICPFMRENCRKGGCAIYTGTECAIVALTKGDGK